MSHNKNSGKADQGSRLYLQQYTAMAKDDLSKLIISASPSLQAFIGSDGEIKWKSPLGESEKGEFYEYRDDFLEVLELDNESEALAKLRDFWPKNGPQWDGLATVTDTNGNKGLLLIEAKAHLDETKSDLRASSRESIKQIENAIAAAQKYFEVRPSDWTKNYYQLGNRLTYLYFINEILNVPSWLVLINFTNGDYKTTNKEQWLKHYSEIFNEMGISPGNHKIMKNLIQIYPEVLK